MSGKHRKINKAKLGGEPITSSHAIYNAFEQGAFRYQFVHDDGSFSRVMKCDNVGELLWLTEQFTNGDKVVIGDSVLRR